MLENNAFTSTVMDQAEDVHSLTCSDAYVTLITASKCFLFNIIKQLNLKNYISHELWRNKPNTRLKERQLQLADDLEGP